MKYWISEKGNDKLIVITDKIIYNYNPRKNQIQAFEDELKKGEIPTKLTGTPFAYFKRIETKSNLNTITIIYGKENELKLDLAENKKEILQYLQENDSYPVEYLEFPESLKSKMIGPGIVLLVILFLTAYTFEIATNMENGYEYTVTGNMKGQALGELIVGMAELLGTKGTIAAGIAMSFLPLLYFLRTIKSKNTIQRLMYNNQKYINYSGR